MKKDLLILRTNDLKHRSVIVFRDEELFDELEECIPRKLDAEVDYRMERYSLRDGDHLKLYFNDSWDGEEYAFEKVKRALSGYYNVRFPETS